LWWVNKGTPLEENISDKFMRLNKFLDFIQREKFFIILIIFFIFLYLINISTVPEKKYIKSKELIKNIQTEIETALSGTSIIEKFQKDDFLRWAISSFSILIILFFLGGLFLNIYYLIFPGKFNITLTGKVSTPKWSILDVIKIAVLIIFIWRLLYIVKNLIIDIFQIPVQPNLINSLVFSTLLHVIAIICIFYFIKYKYGLGLHSLGLTSKKFLRNVSIGILGYISIIPLAILTLIIGVKISYNIGYESEPNLLFLVYFLSSKQITIVYLLLFISVIGPICEEVFFRGFLYKSLRSKFNVKTAVFINSIIFSFLHIDPIGFAPIFFLSIMLSYIYEKTGSLVAPITAHIIHNSVVSIFMLLLREIAIR